MNGPLGPRVRAGIMHTYTRRMKQIQRDLREEHGIDGQEVSWWSCPYRELTNNQTTGAYASTLAGAAGGDDQFSKRRRLPCAHVATHSRTGEEVSQNYHQGFLETRPPTQPSPSPAHTIADQPPDSPSTPLRAHTITDSNNSVSQMPPSRIMHRDRDAVWNTYVFMSLRMQHGDFWGKCRSSA